MSCAATLQAEGIQVELGIPLEINSFEPWRPDLTAVVVGPGIPWDHPTLESLRQEGVQIRGEIELAWEALNDIPWVGITGTNGKTTVTHLLSHVLGHAGILAPMGGNMGVSAADMALKIKKVGKILIIKIQVNFLKKTVLEITLMHTQSHL